MSDAPNRIREFRMAAKLSQQKIADAIGVSKMTISDLERGNILLNLDYMERIADVLKVAPADLLPTRLNPDALDPAERELISRYREATEDERDQVRKVADVLLPYRHEPKAA